VDGLLPPGIRSQITESQNRLTMLGATGFHGDASSKEASSTFAGNGTVLLDAKGGNIDARAATISSEDSLSASLDTTRTAKGFIVPKLGGSSIDRKLTTAQHAAVSSQTEQASSITAGESLNITSGRQVNVYASNLSAGDDLKLTGREVNVLSGTDASNREIGTKTSKGSIGTMGNFKRSGKGMNGKESVTDSVNQATLAAATLSGRNVTLTAPMAI
jgi:filamentous hemagglutinin